MNINNFGILYVVATPIGNLQDISFRAIEILKTVSCIAAEDTRHSLPLLQHYAISTPILSLHEHNERDRITPLLNRLREGEKIALISDAGTPLISDPGYALVQEAQKIGIRVVPIPGPCAAIAALSAGGLPTDHFVFEGFLPAKTKGRQDRLTVLMNEPRTLIFYEAPHRILDCLQDMLIVFGKTRKTVIARELTKKFETIRSGSLTDILEWMQQDLNQQRGEFVILVEGRKDPHLITPSEHILTVLLNHLPLKQTVEVAAQLTGQKKNELYDLALKIKKQL